MNKILYSILLAASVLLLPSLAKAQTNAMPSPGPGALSTNAPVPTSVLQMFESYVMDNDPSCTTWVSNKFVIGQAAVFSSVKGQTGESAIGNDLIAEYNVTSKFAIDSATRFEQVFGDISAQEFGVQYHVYTQYQLRISAGLDAEWEFANRHLLADPNFRLEKASTTLHGLGAFAEYGMPIQKDPGWGRLKIGVFIPF